MCVCMGGEGGPCVWVYRGGGGGGGGAGYPHKPFGKGFFAILN